MYSLFLTRHSGVGGTRIKPNQTIAQTLQLNSLYCESRKLISTNVMRVKTISLCKSKTQYPFYYYYYCCCCCCSCCCCCCGRLPGHLRQFITGCNHMILSNHLLRVAFPEPRTSRVYLAFILYVVVPSVLSALCGWAVLSG